MKRKRSLGGWCGLGLAVAAVVGGAYAGKRYTEQHMLATVLGSGVRAEAVQWHWRQAAGCAEQVEIPLPHARDAHDQAIQLYAPKLWFVYDQAALLRKRFILPRVVIDDAFIGTSTDRLLSEQVVDIGFDTDIDVGSLVELPSGASTEETISLDPASSAVANDSTLSFPCKSTGMSLPWLDQLQASYESISSAKSLGGRQVSVDADMVSERIQAYFADSRSHAHSIITTARDLQQQLVNMDNELRQPQLDDISLHLERLHAQLNKLKEDIGSSGKQLSEEHSRLRQSLLVEKTQLLKDAGEYAAPGGADVAKAMLAHVLKEQLTQPARAVVLMSDLMRKPFDMPTRSRGQQLRSLGEQPEFAAHSARIRGKLELEGSAWPFSAEGKFEVLSTDADTRSAGSSQWHMSIDAQPVAWQLDGRCPSVDAPSLITLSTSAGEGLRVDCQVEESNISGKGQFALRQAASTPGTIEQWSEQFASQYRAGALLRRLLADGFIPDELTPDKVEFELASLQPMGDCQLSDAAVDWLGCRLQAAATACMADNYRQAATQLDTLIVGKLTDQNGMMATLRKDTEQYIAAQQDELRRIRVMVKSLIEQRQTNYYFARQPGEMPR